MATEAAWIKREGATPDREVLVLADTDGKEYVAVEVEKAKPLDDIQTLNLLIAEKKAQLDGVRTIDSAALADRPKSTKEDMADIPAEVDVVPIEPGETEEPLAAEPLTPGEEVK